MKQEEFRRILEEAIAAAMRRWREFLRCMPR